MTKHFRKITKRVLFNAINTPVSHRIVIESGILLTKIIVLFYGAYVLSAGTASGTAIGENPGALVQRMKLEASAKSGKYPGGVIKDICARGILRRMMFDYGRSMPDFNLGATGVTGAAASFTVKTAFDLQLALPRLTDPQMSALRLDQFKKAMLTITTGGRDTLFTGNDRTQDVSGLYFDIVEEREYAGKDGTYQPPVVLYEYDQNVPINQANKKLPIDDLLQAAEAYIDILWIAETTNNALSDGIFNEIFLKAGSEEWFDLKQDDIKLRQRRFLTDAADSMTGLLYTPLAEDLGNELAQLNGAVADLGGTVDVLKPGTDQFWACTRRVAPTGYAA